jgi:Putative bacterial sensory transduction regulator
MRTDQARAYVESLLAKFTQSDKVKPDGDGDYPVRFRNCHYYVRLIGNDIPVVQVFSVAVADVKVTPELLTELNALNSKIRFARAFCVQDQVLIETDVLAEALDPAGFKNACDCVAAITLEVAPGLAERFGGRLTFAEDSAKTDAPQPEPEVLPTGQYL